MEAHAKDLPERSAVIRSGVSSELIAILAVGVMLGGLVFTTASWSRDDIRVVRDDMQVLRGDVRMLRDEVRGVQSDLSDLRERVARIESLLEERSDLRPGR